MGQMPTNFMSEGELKVAEGIPNCNTIFDVGAQMDDSLTQVHPDSEFHIFEPIKDFYDEFFRRRICMGYQMF